MCLTVVGRCRMLSVPLEFQPHCAPGNLWPVRTHKMTTSKKTHPSFSRNTGWLMFVGYPDDGGYFSFNKKFRIDEEVLCLNSLHPVFAGWDKSLVLLATNVYWHSLSVIKQWQNSVAVCTTLLHCISYKNLPPCLDAIFVQHIIQMRLSHERNGGQVRTPILDCHCSSAPQRTRLTHEVVFCAYLVSPLARMIPFPFDCPHGSQVFEWPTFKENKTSLLCNRTAQLIPPRAEHKTLSSLVLVALGQRTEWVTGACSLRLLSIPNTSEYFQL